MAAKNTALNTGLQSKGAKTAKPADESNSDFCCLYLHKLQINKVCYTT
ncbi:unnamed protein product [Gulo gulo]|uniref:Uncharacterized protein n=1 Tax=Gulo gulo TaxID=48420 RepID=A0A9X9PV04_GULGU|nr:unnamed protein product [Gulo gulo]